MIGGEPRTPYGTLLRGRIAVLRARPVPRLRRPRRPGGRRDHVLRRLDPVHVRRRAAGVAHRSRAEVARLGRASWWAAIVQSAGTLFFNVDDVREHGNGVWGTRLRQARVAPGRSSARSASWSPASSPTGRRRATACSRRAAPPGGGSPGSICSGCVFFGIAAVAGYVVPSSGSELDLAWANWNTGAGALCFLACALATLRSGRTSKAPRLHRLRALVRDVESIV